MARRTTRTEKAEPVRPRSSLKVERLDVGCGWCITFRCEECRPELVWYEKLYICGCKRCCDGHPVDLADAEE